MGGSGPCAFTGGRRISFTCVRVTSPRALMASWRRSPSGRRCRQTQTRPRQSDSSRAPFATAGAVFDLHMQVNNSKDASR